MGGYFGSVLKVAKAILLGLSIVVALLGLVLLAANIYVQSAPVQKSLQARLSDELGVPINIESTSFLPWSGLQLSGITIPEDEGATTNFLEAKRFNAGLDYGRLFNGQLLIKEMVLIEPTVVWNQTADEKWELPARPEDRKVTESAPAPVKPEPGPSPETQPVEPGTSPSPVVPPGPSNPPAPPTPPAGEQDSSGFEMQLSKAEIKNGSIALNNAAGEPIIRFSGVDIVTPQAGETIAGDLKSAKASIREKVFLHDVASKFTYTPDHVTLDGLTAVLAKGKLTGDADYPLEKKGKLSLAVQFQQVDLDQLVTEAGGPSGTATGNLAGTLQLQGKPATFETFKGTGRVELQGGQVKQFELFQTLGQFLRIDELVSLKLSRAHLDYHVADEKIFVDELLLESKNLLVRAEGVIKQKGKLNLKARLTINDTIGRQLPEFVEANFSPLEGTNQRFVDFEVTGTLQRPRTNLTDRILGDQIGKQAAGLLDSLLGSKKNKKKEKKKQPEAAVTAPAAPPATTTPTEPAMPAQP